MAIAYIETVLGSGWTDEAEKWVNEGYQSFQKDRTLKCPYEKDTYAYMHWMDGYYMAVEIFEYQNVNHNID